VLEKKIALLAVERPANHPARHLPEVFQAAIRDREARSSETIRTWVTLLAVAIVGATAPAARYGLQHVPGTLAVFSSALILVLGMCVLTGWLSFHLRAARRADATLFSWLTALMPADGHQPIDRAARSGVVQAPALLAPTRAAQLGGPGESILLRARTSRHEHPAALIGPAALESAEEPMMQRR